MRLIVSTMKDEGPFILEWIAYYILLGFDHFIISTNDCSDGTDTIIRRLQELGIASHIDNPGPWEFGPQAHAYEKAMAHPKYAEAEWVMVCDADEFLDIKVGDNTLDALFAACPRANAFAFCWLLFGHSGQVEFADRFITEQMQKCAHPLMVEPHQTRGIKTLFRNNGVYRIASTHRPKRPYPNRVRELRWVDGDGAPMHGFNHQGWAFWQTGQGYGDRMARMNHYAVRSIESYLMKRMRGDVNTTSFHGKMEETGQAYWRLHCWNMRQNTGLASRVDRLTPIIDRLKADPELAELHRRAVAHHRSRIAQIRDTPQAKQFVVDFENYRFGPIKLLQDNVYSDPNAGFDTSSFDPPTFLRAMQMTRYKELRTKQVVHQWPWYMNLDAFETLTNPEIVRAIADPSKTIGDAFRALPPIPSSLTDGIAAAVDEHNSRDKGNPALRNFLAAVSAKKSKRWLLVGGRDRALINDILSLDFVETLHVIEPWGFRSAEAVISQIALDDKRKALDLDSFATVMIFQNAIKAGRLRIIRSTPMDALRLIEDEQFEVAFLHGAKSRQSAEKLLHLLARKITPKGRLIFNAYHSKTDRGRSTMEALHNYLAAHPQDWRVMGCDKTHIVIESITSTKTQKGLGTQYAF
ncbi:MAG: glycosyltransferase family 2 protein [Yoonia sp.]